MNYMYSNIGLCLLLAAAIGFATAALAAWTWFTSWRRGEADDIGRKLAGLQTELFSSQKKIRDADAIVEQSKSLAEATDAKIKVLETRLRAQEHNSKVELETRSREIADLKSQLDRAAAGSASAVAEQDLSSNKLHEELASHQQTVQQHEAKVRQLELKLDEAQQLIPLLREQSVSAGAQKQAAENQAREMDREVRKIMAMREEDFRTMQAQTQKALTVQQQFETNALQIQAETAGRDAENAKLRQDLDAAHTRLAERNPTPVEPKMQQSDGRIEELVEAVAARDRQLQLMQENLLAVDRGEERESQIQALEQELHAVRSNLSDRNDAMARLEADTALLSYVRQGMRERQTRIDGLELQLKHAQSDLRQAIDQQPRADVGVLVERDARIQTLDAELNEVRAKLAETAENIQKLNLDLADREERIGAWESRYETTVGAMHAEAGLMKVRMRELQNQLEVHAKPMAMAAAAGVSSASGAIPVPVAARPVEVISDLQARLRLASLQGIQFLPDGDEILPESEDVLNRASEALQMLASDAMIEIAGHTDSWGDPVSNRDLSLRRAKAVRRYLVSRGANASVLIATGYGESHPIADNESPDGRLANRRIEFQVRGPVR